MATQIGGPFVDGDVAQVSTHCLSPPRHALPVTAGCEARGKAQGRPFHPGATGEGKAERANEAEPSLMPRKGQPRMDGCCSGVQGHRRCDAAGGGRVVVPGRVGTAVPGV